ncbi:MAG: hypothetical protein KAI94_09040, partial [Anaerolineales bacterium]|nr:hypothetical protein [Anaerolineales bacterium]
MLTLWQKLFAMILTFGLAFTIPLSADVAQVNTTRLSVPSSEANARSYSSSISEAGRYVAFRSYASNLVREDTNGLDDIFVHDNQTGTSMRVSLATDGTEANAGSSNPAISDDGRYVAFHSDASNLVSDDTNNVTDVLLHDLQTATTSRISLATAGTEGNGSSFSPDISDDGRYVAFYSLATNLVSGDNNNQTDVFIHDTQTSTTTRVSRATNGTEGNGGSGYPAISGNGRYVAFHSEASNLVTGDTNDVHDVFVHDTQTSTTTRVSEDTAGTQGNDDSFFAAISADGRYVAFYSEA